MSSAIAMPKLAETLDNFASGSSMEANQDRSNVHLVGVSESSYEVELARRRSKEKADITHLYCLVFPATPRKPGGLGLIKALVTKPEEETQEDLDDKRHEILNKIRNAGFTTELVKSSTRKEIICKIGSNDDRILKEAELREYKLELDPQSVKHVLELGVTQIDSSAKPKKPVNPVYLDFANYTDEEYEKIQRSGGEKALDMFRRTVEDGGDAVPRDLARKKFLDQCKANPFQFLHMKYDTDWEAQIIQEHKVQWYRTYNDGTIMRTVDRVSLLQSALNRSVASLNGIKGAGLDLKKLKYKGDILAHYPIQFSLQSRKARDLTSRELYNKFRSEVRFLPFKVFLPWSQPIQDVRDYCGEKIAYYFAFLEFYTRWLAVSTFFGIGLFIAQVLELQEQLGTYDIIQAPVSIEQFTFEENQTLESATAFVSTQPGGSDTTNVAISEDLKEVLFVRTPTELTPWIPLYALAISIWATMFLEYWKRHQSWLAYKWGVSDYERTAEVRPEFSSKFEVPDAVTGLPTPYRSKVLFGIKITSSLAFVGFAVGLTIAVFLGTYVFKVVMATSGIGNEDGGFSLSPTIATQVALFVNSLAIIILGMVFKGVGKKLTDWENHRTDVEYEDNLILKTFIFSFFNSYTTLLYFAFFKSGQVLGGQTQFCVSDLQDFEAAAGGNFDTDQLINIDSCYGSLGYSLLIIFFSQIIVSNGMEFGTPLMKGLIKKYFNVKNLAKSAREAGEAGVGAATNAAGKVRQGLRNEEKSEEPEEEDPMVVKGLSRPLKSPAESQFLLTPYSTPFYDYLELALQFGYVTLFVAAFPLAPFLALLNNMVEVWVDSNKVCILSRRPVISRAQDIGTWLSIFTFLGYLAIVTNSGVLLLTTDRFVITDNEADRVWAFLGFILGVFAIKQVLDFFIPDVPTKVKIQLARQAFIEQKVFFDVEDEKEKVVVMAEQSLREVSDQQLERDYENFPILDTDPYMTSIIDELREKLIKKNIGSTELLARFDTDNNDSINLSELKRALLHEEYGLGDTDEVSIYLFVQALDADNDGKISREELQLFLNEEVDDGSVV